VRPGGSGARGDGRDAAEGEHERVGRHGEETTVGTGSVIHENVTVMGTSGG
jgi:hypothetical protein